MPNNYGVLSGSDDASTRLFDLRSDQQVAVYSHDNIVYGITSLDVSGSSRLIFCGYDNFSVNIFDTLKQERVGKSIEHLFSIWIMMV